MFRFEELEIWRLSIEYGKRCYKVASGFPKYEMYGLADQLRRAGVSISNNIAEGSVGSGVNFKRYLIIAIGSVFETVNISYFAYEMKYIKNEARQELYDDAQMLIKKIRAFSQSLSARG